VTKPPLRTLAETTAWIYDAGFIVSNPHTRTYATANASFLELLRSLGGVSTAEHEGGELRVRDATITPFGDGLLGDPTGLDRAALAELPPVVTRDEALTLAERLFFAVRDEEAFTAYLDRRKNVLDRAHRGDLHQNVGEHVLLNLRQRSVDDWWVDQKFTTDRRGPKEGLYLDVQWAFAQSYFTQERLSGKRVLDFGCGPGLFSRLFAARGASVLGLDTNENHLAVAEELAREDGLEGVAFRRLELPPEVTLRALDETYDFVFLSDVLMFYFHPYDRSLDLDPAALLAELRRVLAPGGTIAVLEPNGTFWQQPWFGAAGRPFTVVTEYRHRRYGVTPTLEELSRAAESAGLVLRRVRELIPPTPNPDDLATGFAAEFPVWWYFELAAS
jgi:SAM-dependent methyltransferase